MNIILAAALMLTSALCVIAILGPMRLHLLTETGLALIGVVCLGMSFTLFEGRGFNDWKAVSMLGLGGLFLVFWGLHRQRLRDEGRMTTTGGYR